MHFLTHWRGGAPCDARAVRTARTVCVILRGMQLQTSVYIPESSCVHACDPRVKILLLLVYTVAIFFIETWTGMALFALLFLGVLAASRVTPARVFRMGIPVYVLAAITVAFAAFNPATGFELGCFYAARIILLLLASVIVTFTTTSSQLLAALAWFLQPFRALRVPVDDIAMVCSLAIRFIPLTAAELGLVHNAQASRGARFDSGGVGARFSAWGNVFISLFVQLFRRADKLSLAMDARCYGAPDVQRTTLTKLQGDAVSAAALMAGIVFMIAVAALL